MGHLLKKISRFLYYTEYSFCRDVLEICLFSVVVYYNIHSLQICVVCFMNNI